MSVLVVDVGSSSMRGILFSEEGQIQGQKQIKYHPTYSEKGVLVEQDPLEYKEALWELLEWTSGAMEDIKLEAITLTAQRSSCICMGWNQEPIGNAICWQDKRTIPLCKELEEKGPLIFQTSGAWVNPVFLGPKLTWIKRERPEVYANTWKFMSIADYLIFLLTGNTRTDDTYASRTHLMNLSTRAWDSNMLAIFGIEEEKLCEIFPVGSGMGFLKEDVARLTGLTSGIPVYSAGGDQQCALVGQGVFEPGIASVTLGTGEFIAMDLMELPSVRSEDLIYNASANRGNYIAEYSAVTCASALDWVMRELFPYLKYEEIGKELLKSKPGANGCLALPYFQGRVTPDHNSSAKAVFSGISLSTRKADLLRAFVEALAVETKAGMERMPKECRCIIVNGGLTATKEICQILADVLNREIYVNLEADATALGAYLVSRVALGQSSNLAEAYQQVRRIPDLKKYVPNPETAALYENLKEENNDLYDRIYKEA